MLPGCADASAAGDGCCPGCLIQLVADAQRLATSNAAVEQGMLFMDVDLAGGTGPQEAPGWHFNEEVQHVQPLDPPGAFHTSTTITHNGWASAGQLAPPGGAGGHHPMSRQPSPQQPPAAWSGMGVAAGPRLSGLAAAGQPGRAADGQVGSSQASRAGARLQPLLLLAVKQLTGHGCQLTHNTVEQSDVDKAGLHQGTLQSCAALRRLSKWSCQGLHPLVLPTELDMLLLSDRQHSALHLHFLVEERMAVVLGPDSYSHLLAMATGNMNDSRSAFQPLLAPPPLRQWNTRFNPGMAFGPSPAEQPAFTLTAEWRHLQGSLVNTPAWWDPGCRPPPQPSTPPTCPRPTPFLRLAFRACSLSLQSMRGSANLHLGFQAQEAQLFDTRPAPTPPAPPPGASTPPTPPSMRRCRTSTRHPFPPGSLGLQRLRSIGRDGSQDSDPSVQPWLYGASRRSSQTQSRGASHSGVASAALAAQGAGRLRGVSLGGAGLDDRLEGEADGSSGSSVSSEEVEVDEGGGSESSLDSDQELPRLAAVVVMGGGGEDEEGGEEGPVVALLHANTALPAEEALHMADQGRLPLTAHSEGHTCFKVMFSYLAEGTMAVEVEVCHALLQWPYLADMSLVSAIVAVFYPPWGQGPLPLLNTLLMRVFLPLLSPQLSALEADTAGGRPPGPPAPGGWPSPASGAAAVLDWPALYRVFLRAATGAPGEVPLSPPRPPHPTPSQAAAAAAGLDPPSPSLEDTGLALSLTALRLGYFFGGDGESLLKVDVRGAAGFVRLHGACVTNFLLPIQNLALTWSLQLPRHAESLQLFRYIM
ncbi:hypothetical protein V8C86DRAFT_3201644 [Haematococcus lacustris]